MVSPKNLGKLKNVFLNFSKLKALDVFSFEDDLMDAVFDLNTIDSHIAGLVQRVTEGKALSADEKASIPEGIFTHDKESLLPAGSDRMPINIKSSTEVYEYALRLEEVICLLRKCIISDQESG